MCIKLSLNCFGFGTATHFTFLEAEVIALNEISQRHLFPYKVIFELLVTLCENLRASSATFH